MMYGFKGPTSSWATTSSPAGGRPATDSAAVTAVTAATAASAPASYVLSNTVSPGKLARNLMTRFEISTFCINDVRRLLKL